MTFENGFEQNVGDHSEAGASSIKTKFGHLFEVHCSPGHCAHMLHSGSVTMQMIDHVGVMQPGLPVLINRSGALIDNH
jgi:hypothetical protein